MHLHTQTPAWARGLRWRACFRVCARAVIDGVHSGTIRRNLCLHQRKGAAPHAQTTSLLRTRGPRHPMRVPRSMATRWSPCCVADVKIRPPMRSRPSSTVTCPPCARACACACARACERVLTRKPNIWSCWAAARPAIPAPTTTACLCCTCSSARCSAHGATRAARHRAAGDAAPSTTRSSATHGCAG